MTAIKLPISSRWKNGSHFDVRVKDGALVVEPGIAKASTAASAFSFGDLV